MVSAYKQKQPRNISLCVKNSLPDHKLTANAADISKVKKDNIKTWHLAALIA